MAAAKDSSNNWWRYDVDTSGALVTTSVGASPPSGGSPPFASEAALVARGTSPAEHVLGWYAGTANTSEFTGEANMPVQIAVYFGLGADGLPLTGRPQAYRAIAKYGGPTTADSAQGGSTQTVLPNTGSAFTQTFPTTGNESGVLIQGGNIQTGKAVAHAFEVEAHNTASITWAICAYFKNVGALASGTVIKEHTGAFFEDVGAGSSGAIPNREAIHTSANMGVHVQEALTIGQLTGVKGYFNASTIATATSITLQSGQGASFSNGQTIMIGTGALMEHRTISGLTGDTFTVAAMTKAHAQYTIVRTSTAATVGNLYMAAGNLTSDVNFQPPAVIPGQITVRFANGAGFQQMAAQTGGTPTTPSAGNFRFYPNGQKVFTTKSEDGVESPVYTGHRRTINTNTTLTALDAGIVARSSAATAVTFTLPAANGVPSGTVFTFVDEAGDASTSNITISRAGSDDISEAGTVGSTKTITTNGGAKSVYSTGGTRWYVA